MSNEQPSRANLRPATQKSKEDAKKRARAQSRQGAQRAGAASQKLRTRQGTGQRPGNQGPQTRRRTMRKKKRKPLWRRLVVGGLMALIILILVPLVAFSAAYAVTKVPEPEELATNQISYIYASDSTTELARIVPPEGNRHNVNIDQVPMHVRQAVLAAEDRDFYTNPGFSITGYIRAATGQILGRSGAGGGSTITQQYVKNAVVGNENSLTRKAKELVISAKMAREWSKDEILQAYLNTIYFGRNAYGISAAAHAYFDKDVSDLTPEEGAVLAASIQRPSSLDPWSNRPEAEYRWNYVLDGMVTIGAMTPEHRATAQYPEVVDPYTVNTGSVAEGTNGLIKTQVLNELTTAGITEATVNTEGLRITTTIDPVMQEKAVDQVKTNLSGQQQGLRAALVSIDPSSGGVKAYYGGDDPIGWDFANAGLQTGSTFKVFALAAALDQGIPLTKAYDSSPVTTGGTLVQNVNNESCGSCSIQEALKRSLNTSFIRLTRDLENGAQDVADMAHRLGVAEELPGIGPTLRENGDTPFEGIALGMYQSRPLDMATALATLTNGGRYYRPHFVEKVETADGTILLDNTNMSSEQVVDESVANDTIRAMLPIADYSNRHGLAGGRASASKTGTAQLGDTGLNKDAWMMGSTPQLATAVWIGTADNQPIYSSSGGVMYGSGLPSDLWKSFMDSALENEPFESFSGLGSTNSVSSQSSGRGSSSSGGSSSTSGSSSSDSGNYNYGNGNYNYSDSTTSNNYNYEGNTSGTDTSTGNSTAGYTQQAPAQQQAPVQQQAPQQPAQQQPAPAPQQQAPQDQTNVIGDIIGNILGN